MTEDNGPHELSFQPRLFTNATNKKTVTIAELYKQLKKLSKELNGLEQETVNTQSLNAVTKQLIAPSLLEHKESGVVSYVSCCIADILRLYAPEAPYDDDEIKHIFNVFIDQLQLLGDSSSQFFPLREYLLTSLATVRTPALVAMLPDAEDIISRFFKVLIGVVKPGLAHTIQMQILDILQQLLEEPKTVPQDVIDIILFQFMKKRQQENPAAHQLASDLANAASDVLQKYIYQYFNDVIVSTAQQRSGQVRNQQQPADTESQRRDRNSVGSGGSLEDLRTAHYLILELNKAAPGTLLNVIPQVEEELGVDDVDIRVLATSALGEMFAEKGFTLAKRYDSTWKTWKGRRADSSPLVRMQWVEHAVSLYQHQPQLSRELNDYIVEKLCDVDEKVRQATCRSLGVLEMTQVVQAAIGENVIEMLGERCKDRRAAVRSDAIIALANIYSQIYDELEQGSIVAQRKWGGIPSKIFMLRFINDPDIDSKVESILTGAILNFAKIKDDRSRCHRLLVVFGSLSHKARAGFFGYMQRQHEIIKLTDAFLTLCEAQGQEGATADAEGANDMMLRKLTVDISARFPEKAKMESALTQMAGLRDSEVYKGLRATMNAENDIKAVRKYQKSALKKLASLAPNILDTTAPLWKCVGLTTINRVLVPFLIQYVSSSSSSSLALGRSMDESQTDLGGTSGLLLEYITRVFPEMLQSYKIELFDVAELRSDAVVAVEDRLALLVKFAKAIPGGVPRSDELENQLASFVRSGVSVRQAKYAAYLITQIEGSEALCAVLVGDTVDNLDNAHIEKRAPAFAAMSRFAQYAPAAFATYAERTSAFLIQTVLMGKFGVQDDDADNMDDGDDDGSSSDEWVERSRLDDAALSKVYAVKILTNWLVGMDLQSVTRDRAQSVVGTLRQLVRGSGEMQQEGKTAPGTKQHLQLTAASCMLKVSSVKQFRDLLSAADIESLALVVQNPCFEVRSAFLLEKLLPMLVGWRLHVRFIPVVFLVAHDPEASLRDNVRHVVQLRLSQIRPSPGSPSVVEDSLVRLLYMLAFHPDWDDSRMVETLELFARYIEFYITCVCSSQNVSLLFCYAGEIKAYRARADAVSRVGQTADMYTRRLYVVSELAQYLLREKSASANWPVNVYPGKLVLPSDIFVAVEAQEARGGAQAYLDAEFIQRRAKAPAGSRTGGASAAAASKRGRARAPSSAAAKRAKGTAAGKQAAKGKGEDGSDAEDVEMSSGDDDDDNDEE